MDGCSWLFILVLGCFFLFLVGFGRFGCFGRHLLLGRVGGVVTEVKGKQHATSLATQPTSMWNHAFPRSMMILLMNLIMMTLFMSHCIKNTLLEAYFQPFIQFTCKIG